MIPWKLPLNATFILCCKWEWVAPWAEVHRFLYSNFKCMSIWTVIGQQVTISNVYIKWSNGVRSREWGHSFLERVVFRASLFLWRLSDWMSEFGSPCARFQHGFTWWQNIKNIQTNIPRIKAKNVFRCCYLFFPNFMGEQCQHLLWSEILAP